MLGGEKFKLVGRLTWGAGVATPSAVSGISCGLFGASSIKWRLAVLVPVPPGVIVIETVQNPPIGCVDPQVLLVIA